MSKKPSEWFMQADYDMDTAEYMFEGKRYVYAVFMCHLSIEKTLKGLYQDILKEVPPNTHSLLFLLEKVELDLPQELLRSSLVRRHISKSPLPPLCQRGGEFPPLKKGDEGGFMSPYK